MLAALGVALSLLRAFDGAVEHGHQLGAAAQSIHGAALDQRFQHAFVQQAQVDLLAEFVDGTVAAELLASGNDRLDGVVADVLHRGQTKANRAAVRCEVGVAHIDVRSLDRDAHLAAFVDVLDHVIGAAGHRCQQRGHELDGIARLQIRRLVGQQRVGGRVRLVEAVSGELGHQIENLLDLFRRIARAAPRPR